MQIKLISLTIVEHQDSLRNQDKQQLRNGPFEPLFRHLRYMLFAECFWSRWINSQVEFYRIWNLRCFLKGHLFLLCFFIRDKCLFSLFLILILFAAPFFSATHFFFRHSFFPAAQFFFCRSLEFFCFFFFFFSLHFLANPRLKNQLLVRPRVSQIEGFGLLPSFSSLRVSGVLGSLFSRHPFFPAAHHFLQLFKKSEQ